MSDLLYVTLKIRTTLRVRSCRASCSTHISCASTRVSPSGTWPKPHDSKLLLRFYSSWRRKGGQHGGESQGFETCFVNRPVTERPERGENRREVRRERNHQGMLFFGHDGMRKKLWEKIPRSSARVDFYPLIEWRRWPEGGIPVGSGGCEGASGNLRTSGETDFEATEITSSGSRGILSISIYLSIHPPVHPFIHPSIPASSRPSFPTLSFFRFRDDLWLASRVLYLTYNTIASLVQFRYGNCGWYKSTNHITSSIILDIENHNVTFNLTCIIINWRCIPKLMHLFLIRF